MEIKVFGPGCANCKKTEDIIRTVVAELGKNANIDKISDFKEMMKYGVMSTPAVAIDGKVVLTGRVPAKAEVVKWLSQIP